MQGLIQRINRINESREEEKKTLEREIQRVRNNGEKELSRELALLMKSQQKQEALVKDLAKELKSMNNQRDEGHPHEEMKPKIRNFVDLTHISRFIIDERGKI